MLAQDLDDLRYAKYLLENPSLAARITSLLGTPIEKSLAMLPQGASEAIAAATHKALETALEISIATLEDKPQQATNWLHKTYVGLSGAAGGAFGLAALAIELPISTTLILRSIADIARSEGEAIKTPQAKLACLEVFALGGRSSSDDATESGYFVVRATLAKTMSEAAQYMAARGVVEETAPPVVRFITQVAARFGVPVTEKAMAQALPVVGAAGGALINTLFIDHFQAISRGHFIVRRLERTYGEQVVKNAYFNLA